MNVAVIFGGESCEHDISIITGVQLISKIDEYLYNIIPIYIDKDGRWLTGDGLKDIDNYPAYLGKMTEVAIIPNSNILYLKKKNRLKCLKSIDFAFVCMHGQRGEDGMIASVLELSKIPYSSSSILASSVSMDKIVFKSILRDLGINSIESIVFLKEDFEKMQANKIQEIENIGYPIIIKPSRQGSSIGIEICKDGKDVCKLLGNSFKYDNRLLIEKFVNIKKEVNVAIFKYKNDYIFSKTEEPKYDSEILGFDEKYRKNIGGFETIKRIMPANIDKDQEQMIKNCALKVYKFLDMHGVVRFDFIIDQDDYIYLNEVNSIPGSMANYLFDDIEYSKLIENLMISGFLRKENDEKLIKKFDSDVLSDGFDGFKK